MLALSCTQLQQHSQISPLSMPAPNPLCSGSAVVWRRWGRSAVPHARCTAVSISDSHRNCLMNSPMRWKFSQSQRRAGPRSMPSHSAQLPRLMLAHFAPGMHRGVTNSPADVSRAPTPRKEVPDPAAACEAQRDNRVHSRNTTRTY